MAGVALFFRERQVDKVVDELCPIGTVGIVTFCTAGNGQWLTRMRCLNGSILGIVAVQTKSRIGFGQVEDTLWVAGRFSPVCDMACGAAHVHGRVRDLLGDLPGNVFVAAKAEVRRSLPSLRSAA